MKQAIILCAVLALTFLSVSCSKPETPIFSDTPPQANPEPAAPESAEQMVVPSDVQVLDEKIQAAETDDLATGDLDYASKELEELENW
jgi:hypothetical protein